ncbi:MAG: NHL repeat-containing protein [Blastocatellia bacterium]|nr:NHL repeat-containing protein [Blastocatellia bacterium]
MRKAAAIFYYGGNLGFQGLIVSDTLNNRIQTYNGTAWSVVTTPALAAPEAVTASADGQSLYIADTNNNRVVYSNNGGFTWNVLTSAGQVSAPQGLARDSQGNVYVADTGNGRVLRFNGGAPMATPVVIYSTGTAVNQVQSPRGLAINSSFTLYVAERGAVTGTTGRILKVTNANGTPGTFAQVAGYGSSAAPLGQVRNPESVAVDLSTGTLYVADTGNNRVLSFANGNSGPATLLCSISVSLTDPPLGQVRAPEGVAICSGTLLGGSGSALMVGDTQNNRVQGRVLSSSTWGLVGTPNGMGTGVGQFRGLSKMF